MNAHIIAFAVRQIITRATLLELRDAYRIARHVGDANSADLFWSEIQRRMTP